MGQVIEIEKGEIKVKFTGDASGKYTFEELGLTNEQLVLEGGFLRLVLDLEGVNALNYYAVPTIEVGYIENTGETCPGTCLYPF